MNNKLFECKNVRDIKEMFTNGTKQGAKESVGMQSEVSIVLAKQSVELVKLKIKQDFKGAKVKDTPTGIKVFFAGSLNEGVDLALYLDKIREDK